MKVKFIVFFLFFLLVQSKVFSCSFREKDTANYTLLNQKGKKVKLSDFKGKVVYVDFWASWCGGCKEIMKLSKELHDRFSKAQRQKIVFVYISIDNDSLAWQKAIEQIGTGGVNLISPAKLPNAAGTYFNVTGLPRYMTIDKSGKIVAFIAKSPQQEGVYEDLLQLIEQKD